MISKKFFLMLIVFFILGIGLYLFNKKPVTPLVDSISTDQKPSRYVGYSIDGYELYKDRKRILFFHAKWCPTCKVADTELKDNMDQIPEDVIVFKLDYDTETELKSKYGITYQHTFVLVDKEGKEIRKWNGGDVNEIISNSL